MWFCCLFLQTARRRHGVPHITQPHQLVMGAVQALDTLLPNFRNEVSFREHYC